jgi:Zn-dependent membrane protease YugP
LDEYGFSGRANEAYPSRRGKGGTRGGRRLMAAPAGLRAARPARYNRLMPIALAVLGLLFVALVLGPQWWVRRVLVRHGVDRPDLPGTGAELARHLLDQAGLGAVAVERSDQGDHYDPVARAVRLIAAHHDGRSVAAAAVAAHEVSHALQHARGERAFSLRFALVNRFAWIDRVASIVLLLAPVVFIAVKAPVLLALQLACGFALLLARVAIHVVTLPVEFDASFAKALPVLDRGRYLAAADLPAARSVLRAAAWTYVAAALATLFDIARWFRMLRF